MTRVVSLTRNAVERDTRVLKVASSIARLGHESLVIEGVPSELDPAGLDFELRPLFPHLAGGEDAGPPDPSPGERPAGVSEGNRARIRAALPAVGRGLIEAAYVLASAVRENRRLIRSLPPADAYYLHSALHYPAARTRARRSGAKLIFDAHDANWALDTERDAGAMHPLTLRLLKRADRICALGCDGFITVGASLADLFEEHVGRRPLVVRNCHDFRLDRTSPTDVRRAAGLGDDVFLLVMTGAPKPGDTVAETFAALESLPGDVHLALVGPGQGERRRAVADRGLAGRVHLLDPVPPTEVASFIRTADAAPILYQALSPAYLVSLPNRFFHAVAAGLPVLYPDLPDVKELCERYELGIEIDPTSPESIAGAVRRLYDDEQLRGRCAARVRAAQAELSWEREEATLAALLGEPATVREPSG